jgi:anti-sigma regulatory factor (Ser/Thr protein kinase)
MVHVNLEADSQAPAAARRHVAALLRARGVDHDDIDVVCLAVSELATNALVHTGAAFAVDVSMQDDAVHVEVLDTSPRLPHRIPAGVGNGRGLAIVEELARSWGADPIIGGKVVWCDLPVHAAAPDVAPRPTASSR